MEFDSKCVIVTGGSKGIGKGIARGFLAKGANVLITGRSESDLKATVQELGPSRCLYFQGDMGDKSVCAQMAAFALEKWGRIDVLVCNAGLLTPKLLADMTEDDLEQMFRVNVKGNFWAAQACSGSLEKSGAGRIVLISSITGPHTAMEGWSHYGATKAAQLGFMRNLAVEYAQKRITVNAVLPGNILTEGLAAMGEEYLATMKKSIPLSRLGSVDDIANAVIFLSGAGASFITGQTLVVDGGQLLPEG